MSYLHGVKINEISEGASPIRSVDSAIIGLVGTAEKGEVNKPILITSLSKAREIFGKDIGGLTIMSALETIYAHGGGQCVVVNVLEDPKTVITSGKINTTNASWDTQLHEATMTGSDSDFSDDVIKGLDNLLEAESTFGVKPKILISPGYSQVNAVKEKLREVASRLRAKAIVDIAATTVTTALTERQGTYNVSDDRLLLCFPNVIRYNTHEAVNQIASYSQYVAAAIVSRDAEQGYWYSPSNYQLVGVLDVVTPIRASLEDPTADTNMLNAQGIMTIYRSTGTGYRVWGNWTTAFPSSSNLENMIAPGRVKDVLHESLISAALSYIDRPINQALIDSIKESVNAFIRTLIGNGAIVDGSCTYGTDDNPATEVSQGKLKFRIAFSPSPSLEAITFESFIDINLLKSIQ